MRILDLCEFYSERGGGVRSYLAKLTKAASVHDHEVVVVAPGPRDEETRDDETDDEPESGDECGVGQRSVAVCYQSPLILRLMSAAVTSAEASSASIS